MNEKSNIFLFVKLYYILYFIFHCFYFFYIFRVQNQFKKVYSMLRQRIPQSGTTANVCVWLTIGKLSRTIFWQTTNFRYFARSCFPSFLVWKKKKTLVLWYLFYYFVLFFIFMYNVVNLKQILQIFVVICTSTVYRRY